MDIQEKYDAVNAMLKQLGNDPIQMPEDFNAQGQLQHLLNTYRDQLLENCPQYKTLPDPRIIPDMILQYIYGAMDELAEEFSPS